MYFNGKGILERLCINAYSEEQRCRGNEMSFKRQGKGSQRDGKYVLISDNIQNESEEFTIITAYYFPFKFKKEISNKAKKNMKSQQIALDSIL